LFNWLRPVVKVLHALSTNEALKDTASHVRIVPRHLFRKVELSIHQVFSPSKTVLSAIGVLLSVRISLLISARAFSRPRLLDGQTCRDRLRRSSRYLRMHRELP
jgi:hypothetical protein